MNLLTLSHLLKKDVRHSRTLLSVWLLMVALQCALMGSSANPGDQAMQAVYLGISVVAPLFQALVLLVIVPTLIQEEPLVGTTAFWFTRPIPRSTLLKSKALFVGLLVALPMLAEAGVLAANGVTLRDVALAIPEIVITQLSWIVGIAVVASLTPSFARFMIVGVIVCLAMILLSLAVTGTRMLLRPEEPVSLAAANFSVLVSRGVARSLAMILGGGAVVAHQYLTRRTARSIVGAVVLAAASFAIGNFWPWDFLARETAPSGESFDADAAKVSLGRTHVQDAVSIRGFGPSAKTISADIVALGLPPGYVAETRSARAHLSLPDGTPLEINVVANNPGYFLQPDVPALESALGGTPIVNGRGGTPLPVRLFGIAAENYGKYADQPLAFSADLSMIASTYRITAEMPVVRGSRYDHGSEHEIVTDVLRQGDSVEIELHQQTVQLMFDRNHPLNNPAEAVMNRGDVVYVLRNKNRNEAIIPKQSVGIDFAGLLSASISVAGGHPLVQKSRSFSFGPEPTFMRRTPDLDDAWLAGAELVRLQRIPVAEFSRHLAADKFKLKGEDFRAPRSADAGTPPNPGLFAHLDLPAGATREQTKAYIDDVLVAAQGGLPQRYDSPDILRTVGMLAKVGPKNIDLLLSADNRDAPYETAALTLAAAELAQPADKMLILRELSGHPGLVSVVAKYGWQGDAHETLVSGLQDEAQNQLPAKWIQTVASFGETSTYPALKAYLVRCSNREQTFNAIRRLPGIDLTEAVDSAWKKAKYGLPRQVVDAAGMAGEFGHIDVLDALVEILKENNGTQQVRRRAAAVIRKLTPATGNSAALVAWFEANQGKLVFDSDQRKFLPAAAGAPAAN